jgi:hypothetical protein
MVDIRRILLLHASRPRQLRRTPAVAVLLVGVVLAVLPASAETPETGVDPSATLTVSPSDALSDGQTVTVTGSGFPPNTAGIIRECGGSVAAPQCDLALIVPFVTTATGDIPPTSVTVKRIVDTGTTTFNCGVQVCALVATAGERTSQHHIRMAGAGTVLPTSVPPTSVPPTSVPPTSVTPTSVPPPSVPSVPDLVCPLVRGLLEPLAFLSEFISTLLALLGCPVRG